MRNTQFEGKELPDNLREMVDKMSCDSIQSFRSLEEKERTAVLNVLEEDQVVFHISLKNKFGAVLASHQQKLSTCPSFTALRNLKNDEQATEQNTITPAAVPAIPSAAEAAPAAAYSGSDEAAAH